jgi:hypothetical protein
MTEPAQPTAAHIEAALQSLPAAFACFVILARAQGASISMQTGQEDDGKPVVVITLIDEGPTVERIRALIAEMPAKGPTA